MKLHHSLLAMALLAAASPAALAASTADMSVVGTIVPGSCTLTLSNGGVVNLGQIDINTLDPTTPTALAEQAVSVSIACTAAAKFATMATENRAGTSTQAGDSFFGLGDTSAGNNIGHFEMIVANPTGDGVAATAIGSTNLTTWTTPAGGVKVEHGAGAKYTAVGATATGPASLTAAAWDLRILPTIAGTDTIALTGVEPIDGSVTLDIVYL